MQSQETSLGNFFKLPNPGLRSYFKHVVHGQPEVYDTPFAKGENTEQMLDNWLNTLESIHKTWPTLWNFEVDLASKVGPTSIMKPLDERWKDIDSYYTDILSPCEPLTEQCVAAVLDEFTAIRGLRFRHPYNVVEHMKLSTNSGSPYFTKRKNVVAETLSAIWKQIFSPTEVLSALQYGDNIYDFCAVLGWRGQEGGPTDADTKQRVVWMFPFAVNLWELTAYQPLIQAAQNLNLVPAWVSNDKVDITITQLFDSKGDGDLVVCTDFTKFDQHFNSVLQDGVRSILTTIFTPTDYPLDWFKSIFPIKYSIPLACDELTIREGLHGMASGSAGTNADETLAHRALQYAAAQRSGVKLNPNSQCLGDDGILSYPGIAVEDVVREYASHGLEMNLDKQYFSTQDCVYLRRWHHKDYRVDGVCRGVYSTCRALGRLRYLERYYDPEVWGPRAVALRQLSIIENVKYHPLKVEFAEFCMKRDKFRLGLDIPGFLDNIAKYAMDAIGDIPDLLGYTKTLQGGAEQISGIENWWIVQYLKSKA